VGLAGPALAALGASLGSTRLRRAGALAAAGFAAAMADIGVRPTVPGANDDLSGLAALLAAARALAADPPPGLRIVLLSTDAEESFLEGMLRFGERHFRELPTDSTTFVCLESVGSPRLFTLDGEGFLRLRRYPAEPARALQHEARRLGIPLRDPFRYRFATDGQVPLRAGYPTVTLTSMDATKAPSNYHWPSDRPENLDTGSIADAARLAEAFSKRLQSQPSR
jgi:Zn-dependent M28 family amino/carboxypeptidase